MGAVSVLAVVCAAAAGWLLLSPRPGSSRVRKIEMASVPRAEPVRATIAGSPDRGGRPARGVGSSAPARGAAALLAGLALAGMIGGVAGTAVGVVGAVTAWVFLGRLEPAGVVRGRRRLAAAVPLVADLLAAGLAAGSPPDRVAEAVGQAVGGPLGERLCQGATALRLGAEPVDAWSPLLADPASRPLGRALAGAVTRGSSPTGVLARVASDARDRARWEAEARARALGARAAAPLGLCFLPAFVLVAIVPLIATVALPLLP